MNMQKLCKTSVKRVMSLILTVCMLFSILPTGVISVGNDGAVASAVSENDLYFNMLKATADAAYEGAMDVRANYIVNTTYEMTSSLNASVESDPWQGMEVYPKPNQMNPNNCYIMMNKDFGIRMISTAKASQIDGADGVKYSGAIYNPVFMRFRVKVENDGYYLPYASVNRAGTTSRAMSTVHKYDATNNKLGEVVMSEKIQSISGSGKYDAYFGYNPIKLTKGEYVITIGVVDPSGSGTEAVFYSRLDLRGYGFKFMGATDTTLNVSGKMDAPIEIGESVEVPLTITAKDGSDVDFENLTAEFIYTDKDIATAELVKTDDSASVKVSGVAFGSTNVTVRVKSGNYTGEYVLTVPVRHNDTSAPEAADLTYNLLKGATSWGYNAVTQVTYDWTTAGSATEKNPAKASTPWSYFTRSVAEQGPHINGNTTARFNSSYHNGLESSATSFAIYTSTAKYIPFTVSIKIQVPVSGWYTPYMSFYANGGTAIAGIYEYDAVNNAIGNAVMADTSIASVAGESALSSTPIELDAGEYIIKFGSNQKSSWVYATGFRLAYMGAKEAVLNITATEPTEAVNVGSTVNVPLNIMAGDGKNVDLSKAVVTAECTDKGIVSVTSKYNNGALSLDVEGEKFGSTQVTVNVTADAYTGSASFRVAVRNSAQPAGKDLVYDFYKAFNDDKTVAYLDKITYNVTTPGAEGETRTDRVSEPWAFFAKSPENISGNDYVKYNDKNYGIAYHVATTGMTITADFKIQVPKSGYYVPVIGMRSWSEGNTVLASLSNYDPIANTKGSAIVASKVYTINTGTTPTPISDSPVYLEAGEYILTYGANKKASLTAIENATLQWVGNEAPIVDVVAKAPTESVNVGGTIDVPLTVTDKDGAAVDISSAVVSATYTDKGIASVSTKIEDGKLYASVKGEKFGSTAVTVKVKAGMNEGTATFRVAVRNATQPAGADLYYNIMKAWTGNTDYNYLPTITYDMLTAGSATELNSNKVSQPWAYFSRNPLEQGTDIDGNTYSRFVSESLGLWIGTYDKNKIPATVTLKIQVPTTGYYMASADVRKSTDAGGTFSMHKYNAIEDTKGEAVVSQIALPLSGSGNTTISVLDEPIYLEAGEYLFTYGATERKAFVGLHGFTLQWVGDKPINITLAPKTSSASILQGRSTTIPVNIAYSVDGVAEKLDFDTLPIEVTNSDNNVADVTLNKAEDGVSLKIDGKNVGATTVSIAVTLGGIKKTATIGVSVEDSAQKDLYYDFLKSFSKECKQEYMTGITYDYNTAGSATERNPGKYPTAAWAWHSYNTSNYIKYNYENYGIYFAGAGTLDLKIRVPVSGWYKADVLYYMSAGGSLKTSLRAYDPSGDAVGDIILEGSTVNCAGSDRAWFNVGDKAVYLEEGEYIVEVYSSGGAGCVDAFRLQVANLAPQVVESIKLGESVVIPAFRGAKMQSESLSASLANAELADVSVNKENGTIILTAKAAGETTLTATADGASYTIPVKFIDPSKPDAKSIYFDFVKANTYSNKAVRALEINSYNLTAAGSTEEIGAGKTNAYNVANGAWKYHSRYGDTQNGQFEYQAKNAGLIMAGNVKHYIKLIIPETGTYQITPDYTKGSGKVAVKLYGVNELGSFKDGIDLGVIDNSVNSGESFPGVFELTAGEYILSVENSVSTNKVVLNGVLFKNPDVITSAPDVAMIRGQSKKIEAVLTDKNGQPIDATNVSVKTSLSNSGVADVVVIKEGGKLYFQIDSIENGSVIVNYEVITADGKLGVNAFEAFVNPAGAVIAKTLRYDYLKLSLYRGTKDPDYAHKGEALTNVTEFAMTTKGDPKEINPDSEIVTEPWHFVSSLCSQIRYADDNYGLIFDYEPATAVFKIRVKETGLYRPVSINSRWQNGPILKIWLAPDGASNPTADEYLIGNIDTYGPANVNNVENLLKISYLEKGDYVLTYKMEGRNEALGKANGRVGLNSFELRGMDANTIIVGDVQGPDMIPVGQPSEYVLNALESDGLNTWATPMDVTISTTNDIIDYQIIQNEDKTETKLNIMGKAQGNTIVTFKVSMDGLDKEFALPLTVYDAGATATRDYVYNFLGTVPTGMVIAEVDSFAKTMDGSPDELMPSGNTDPWCFAHQVASAFYVYNETTGGICLGTGVGATGGIKIRLPSSGIFTPQVKLQKGNMNGTMRLYIAPVDAEDPMDEKWSVGAYDTYGSGELVVNMRTIKLDAGDYIATFKIVAEQKDKITAASRLWLRNLTLHSVTGYPAITVIPEGELAPMKLGNSSDIKLTSEVADGSLEDFIGAEFEVDPAFADKAMAKSVINADGSASLNVTGLKVWQGKLGLILKINGVERSKFTIPVEVLEPAALASVAPKLRENDDNILINRSTRENTGNVQCVLTDVEGDQISEFSAQLQNAEYAYSVADTSIVTVDANGVITPKAEGTTQITVTVTIAGVTKTGTMDITVVNGKSRRSYYTEDKVAAAQENVIKYDWARSTLKSTIAAADKFLGMEEDLWNLVTTQELPRSYYVGYRNDPNAGMCRYCGVNIGVKYGSLYAWVYDAINMPWKIQCPDCRRKFPSNDFEGFYKLGLDQNGNWRYQQALDANAMLVEAGGTGYLTNVLYPEKGAGWGVDDGYGYDTGNYSGNVKEVHTYISFYNHWAIWHANGRLYKTVQTLQNAYLYTGDARYGRLGAILLDRIADVYPDLDTRPYRWQLTADASYAPHGKAVDLIWENQLARDYSKAYDAFFPMYEDEYVIKFLSEKAEKYGLKNPKTSSHLIRENLEDGILRETYKAAYNGTIKGNFGMTESAVGAAAIVLDTMPETRQWLDWVFQDGESTILYPESKQADLVTGGNVMRQIIDKVDRDGIADEVAPNYANIWIGGLNTLITDLAGYDKYSVADMFKNPRVIKLYKGMHALTMSRYTSVQIGDSGGVADADRQISNSRALPAWQNTKDPEFAQILYFLNGNKTDGLHYDIFKKDPESLQSEIQEVIEKYGEYKYFDESRMLAGYGLAALRGGTKLDASMGGVDTQHTFWMSFVRGAGHGHNDLLNLGIEAYGANIAPELGYPNKVIGDLYGNWGKATVAHNTVVVNQSHQRRIDDPADPLHFDDAGMVQLADVDASDRYLATDIYRRTIVSVAVSDEISYALDFFRVKGGTEHLYSFHALTRLLPEFGSLNEGVTLTAQAQKDDNGKYVGSYAGPGVPFEREGVNSGFSYLKNVDRVANPGSELFVNFHIENLRNKLSADRDVYLKLTMLNSFDLEELAFADGKPAEARGNPETIKYMLAKRTGVNLDSLFTTVYEPYDKTANITKAQQLEMRDANGRTVTSQAAKAVKVELVNGRTDYIVYSADNSAMYSVMDKDADGNLVEVFKFQGFVGVYSMKDGKNIYSYLNDGTKLGDMTATAAVTGHVVDFTKELTDKNTITVKFDDAVDLEAITGKWIYINNDASGNAAYEILGADTVGENVELDIGDVTLIDTVKSAEAGEYTYNHNITAGETSRFRIPLNAVNENRPVFAPINDDVIMNGRTYTTFVHAESPLGYPVTLSAASMPRGAVLNTETGEITWKPDSYQIGKHVFAIKADDGAYASIQYFTVEVVKSSEGSGALSGGSTEVTPSVPGGGSAGGGSTTPTTPTTPSTPSTDDKDDKDDQNVTDPDQGEETPDTGDTPETPAEKFVDLGNHTWAENAIYSLVDKGVVNGTSSSTYAPANNIKRADFAIMLVRAFGITEGEGENFADVDSNKYYAEELRLAKAAGIVNGVGDDKFNPEGEITRQDMMLMLSRALDAMEVELSDADLSKLADFADAAQISDYAADAVSRMIKDGIIAGSNGKINPLAKATRAEIAVMLDRVLADE